jgi:ribosomal protein S12 methylthiotransferase accessory factor
MTSTAVRAAASDSPDTQETSWRIRSPEETWSLIEPRLPSYGITRIADLTGLDIIGVPVYMGVRPLATTLCVGQGKGKTHLSAQIGAAMEAIEFWAAERFRPADAWWALAAELGLPYRVEEITSTERSVLSELLPLPWVLAESLTNGTMTPVPLHSVQMDGIADGRWRPRGVVISTNGMAGGNNLAEATAQALLEVVERHAHAGLGDTPISQRKVFDLTTLPDGWCRRLIERMQGQGFWVEAVDCSNLPGVYTFAVWIWRGDMPGLYGGAGSQVLPELALYRALTEAVQSRMSVISGLRENMTEYAYPGVRRTAVPPTVPPSFGWADLPAPMVRLDSGEALTAWLTSQITAVSGRPVLRVDLTPPGEPIAVCQVIAPGLTAHDVYRELPRDPEEATS